MGIIELLLLAVGLAMDSFAVSICKGLAAKKLSIREYLACGIWFGFFQGFMPFIGYLAGSRFEKLISIIAPWLAFILLSLIGGNMIREAFGEKEEEEEDPGFDVKTMFMMAIATSIDALAVGIAFVAIPVKVLNVNSFTNMVFAVIVIGVVTFFISMLGVKIGSLFGTRYKSGSEAMGGTILIFIGLRNLIEHLDKANTLGNTDTIFGMLIPLLGTVLGAAFVYGKKNKVSEKLRSILAGGSSGIMISISVWGMIEPSVRGLRSRYTKEVIPVLIAFSLGVIFQYLLDQLVPHTHVYSEERRDGVLWLNPGSCGPRRFNQAITMAVLDIQNGTIAVSCVDIPHQGKVISLSKEVDLKTQIEMVMKETQKGRGPGEIATRHGWDASLVEQIARLYVTHPGVTADEIMGKMGI